MKHLYKQFEFSRLVYKRGPEAFKTPSLSLAANKTVDDPDSVFDEFKDSGLKEINSQIDALADMGEITDGRAKRLKRRVKRKVNRVDKKLDRELLKYDRRKDREMQRSYKAVSRRVERKTQDLLGKLESKARVLLEGKGYSYQQARDILKDEIFSGSLKGDVEQVRALRGDYYPIKISLIVDGSDYYEAVTTKNSYNIFHQDVIKGSDSLRYIKPFESRVDYIKRDLENLVNHFEGEKENPSLVRREVLSIIKTRPSFEKDFNLIKQILDIRGSGTDELYIPPLRLGDFVYTPFINSQGDFDIRVS